MSDQLAFALLTPYTIRKSRTGAVVSRLLGRTSAELIATQIFTPSLEVSRRYADSVHGSPDPEGEKYRVRIHDYILENLPPRPNGLRNRTLMLVFRGENARSEIADAVGKLNLSNTTGETIRDTYGDLVWNHDGSLRYFEPAVLCSEKEDAKNEALRLWLDFARTQPALAENTCVYDSPAAVQRTLVIIKPDSWRARSSRPGAIIDMFSRTGLRIIAAKLCHISVAQAMEFYGPVKDFLCKKLAPGIGARARQLLEKELDVKLADETEKILADSVGVPAACDQFEKIIKFMTGWRPSDCPRERWGERGKVKSLAMVYEGENAVAKIRDVLGPTDPTKAPGGTVRHEFGSDVMVNTAHASDSPDNARREMGILQLEQGNFAEIVEKALNECKG